MSFDKKRFVVQVVPLAPLKGPLTYACHESLFLGQIVQIPFRSRSLIGVVWETDTCYKGEAKSVEHVYPFILPEETRQFVHWVANYNVIPLGMALKLCLPQKVCEKEANLKAFSYQLNLQNLSKEQEEAYSLIQDPTVYLLDGVTGSGKTEVYFHALASILEKGQQGLVLLPEIALTNQWIKRFEEAFGIPPLLWHSNMTPAKRRVTWQTVLQKEPCIVVGARSALFLPFHDLGMIVVDEEHDPSFKQNEYPFYQARDMAIVRAHFKKIPILLGSATPSLETYSCALHKRYKHLRLPVRFGKAVMPHVHVVDMKHQKGWISQAARTAIQEGLKTQTQTLIYLNRRGYAPLCICIECGYKMECQSCHHPLTLHQKGARLLCHRCGFSKPPIATCPQCQKENPWRLLGPGIERIEEILKRSFSTARFLTLSSDSKNLDFEKIMDHEVDIIIGTQILAKGHHFPLLTRVIVIDADMGLIGNDFRATERTFQLLHQVAGRAGREAFLGHVWLQTLYPDHPVIHALAGHKRDALYRLELEQREAVGVPPFARYAALILSSFDPQEVEKAAKALRLGSPLKEEIEIFGPAPAHFAKLRGQYRWRFLIRGPKGLQSFVQEWVQNVKLPSCVKLRIDMDPYDFC